MVRLIWTGDCGIVETPQKDWKAWLRRKSRREENCFDTYDDILISVVYLQDNGDFVYGQANPLDLERYPLKSDGTDFEALLLCASDLYRGEGSPDILHERQTEYRKRKEAGIEVN